MVSLCFTYPVNGDVKRDINLCRHWPLKIYISFKSALANVSMVNFFSLSVSYRSISENDGIGSGCTSYDAPSLSHGSSSQFDAESCTMVGTDY